MYSLYLLTTTGFSVNWAANAKTFIVDGQNVSTVFKAFLSSWIYLVVGSASAVSTILTDATLIWRCWVIWSCN
ncbi:hypothetical protein EDD85DRAFT_251460 [Armillaria nabsnona]|nr:hypothetical protein EDD85DRAFT_251460 [Armillaria nabsnona]